MPDSSLTIAVDVGTSSIRSLAVRGHSPTEMQIVAAVETASDAFSRTSPRGDCVTRHLPCPAALGEHLRHVAAEVGKPIDNAACCCSGVRTHHRLIRRTKDLGRVPRSVGPADITQLIEEIRDRATRPASAITAAIANDYHLDGARFPRPLGASACRLGLSLAITTAAMSDIGLLSCFFEEAGSTLDFYGDWTMAAGLALLTPEERLGNRLVIDIGADLTRAAFYSDGVPLLSNALFYGGKLMTADLAYALGDDAIPAESVKRELSAHLGSSGTAPDGGTTSFLKGLPQRQVEFLDMVVKARLEEILQLVLGKNPIKRKLDSVILTGGGARYHAAESLAGAIFHAPSVTRHRPVQASAAVLPENGSWAVAFGICLLRLAAREPDLSLVLAEGSPILQFPDYSGHLNAEINRQKDLRSFWRDLGSHFSGRGT